MCATPVSAIPVGEENRASKLKIRMFGILGVQVSRRFFAYLQKSIRNKSLRFEEYLKSELAVWIDSERPD